MKLSGFRDSNFCFLLSLLILGLTVVSSAKDFNATLWLQNFYQYQNMERFQDARTVWRARKTLETVGGREPVIGFLSYHFKKDSEFTNSVFDDQSGLTAVEREVFGEALWRSGLDQADSILARAVLPKLGPSGWAGKPTPAPIPKLEITKSEELDLCWGYFFGSGEPAAIGPVVLAMKNSDEKARAAMQKYQAIETVRDVAFRQAVAALKKEDEAKKKNLPGADQFKAELEKHRAEIKVHQDKMKLFHDEAYRFAIFEASKMVAGIQLKTPSGNSGIP